MSDHIRKELSITKAHAVEGHLLKTCEDKERVHLGDKIWNHRTKIKVILPHLPHYAEALEKSSAGKIHSLIGKN